MKKNVLLLILWIVIGITACADLAYIAFAIWEAVVTLTYQRLLVDGFLWISLACLILNVCAAAYSVVYVKLRKE